MIPAIIHQTGPRDANLWPEIWHRCHQSWQQHFADHRHIFWTDSDLDRLIHQNFPEYSQMWHDFPLSIMRIDFARFCMLYQHGGIYADLDMFCYRNFHDELTSDVVMVQNPQGNDPVENSLMAAKARAPWLRDLMQLIHDRWAMVRRDWPAMWSDIRRIAHDDEFYRSLRPFLVFYVSGTNAMAAMVRRDSRGIALLPGALYNNHYLAYDPEFRTKHIRTGSWGYEYRRHGIDLIEQELADRGVDSCYDPYHDYTQGMLRDYDHVFWDRNDTDHWYADNFPAQYL